MSRRREMKTNEELEKIVDELILYYANTRQVGHTTLMKQGVGRFWHYDRFFVLCVSYTHGRRIGIDLRNVVSLDRIDHLRGYRLPLVVDNQTFDYLLREMKRQLIELRIIKEELLKTHQNMKEAQDIVKTLKKELEGLQVPLWKRLWWMIKTHFFNRA